VGQIFVGDHPGVIEPSQWLEALDRLLDHGALAIERQYLLGPGAAGSAARSGFRCLPQESQDENQYASTWKTHPK